MLNARRIEQSASRTVTATTILESCFVSCSAKANFPSKEQQPLTVPHHVESDVLSGSGRSGTSTTSEIDVLRNEPNLVDRRPMQANEGKSFDSALPARLLQILLYFGHGPIAPRTPDTAVLQPSAPRCNDQVQRGDVNGCAILHPSSTVCTKRIAWDYFLSVQAGTFTNDSAGAHEFGFIPFASNYPQYVFKRLQNHLQFLQGTEVEFWHVAKSAAPRAGVLLSNSYRSRAHTLVTSIAHSSTCADGDFCPVEFPVAQCRRVRNTFRFSDYSSRKKHPQRYSR